MVDIEDFTSNIPTNTLSSRDIEDVFAGEFKKASIEPMKDEILQDFFNELTRHTYKERKDYEQVIKILFRKYKILVNKTTLVHYYRIMLNLNKIIFNPTLEVFMRKRVSRSASGVVVITVFTGPSKFSCPMDCHYCPQERDEHGNMTQPRSYSSGEPGSARGAQNKFDPIKQTLDRIASLEMTGHIEPTPNNPCKLEFIVSGGTFNFYPKDYLMEFMTSLYYACNCYYEFKQFYISSNAGEPINVRPMKSIEEEQKLNESATHRVIGMTIETRPDWITKKGTQWTDNLDLSEIKLFRQYGVTRIQIGVQHTDDYILKKVNRKCTNEENKWGIYILKQNGFKVDIHIMLDLPYSSPEKDKVMLQEIIDDPNYQADQWKLYPTLVLNFTKMKEWYDEGTYKPYAENNNGKDLIDVLIYVKKQVYPWIRINRVFRDFPTKEIMGGSKMTHMRDAVLREMDKENIRCNCLRCREVKFQNYNPNDMKFKIDKFEASRGTEYFLSYTSNDEHILYGYLRLRINNSNYGVLPILRNTAMIRELHVLGMQVSVNNNQNNENRTQHKKLGTKLIRSAEFIAWLNGYNKISIISGVGVRDYYRKKGYELTDTYMIKKFTWKYLLYLFGCIIYESFIKLYFLIEIINIFF
jgi:ELP3 family radical SAM enzyme/protein acetyltransferase